MTADLKGKRAVVFGGASGAGLASARLLATAGAEVIVAGFGTARVDPALGLATREVDGKDTAAVERAFDEIGAFDHLVITAGQTDRGGPFKEMSVQKLRDTFEGKFFVQINAAHAAARHLRVGGSITFFSGGASRKALQGMSNIAAVNGAIDAVVPTLAIELAPTRVNAISPGTLRTSYWTGVPDEQLEAIFGRMAKALPVGRVGTAEDIANAVLFVVTTGYVNGTVLAVDGGLPHTAM